jgi:photosystem II stability/assembly factor-like uncharacterized protein
MQNNYVIVVYYSSGRIYYSSNYGLTFSLATGAPSGAWFSCAISGQNALACGDGLLYISSNYGQSWSQVTGLIKFFTWCAMCDNLAIVVEYVGTRKVYVSTNYGANWVICTSASAFTPDWRGASITKHPSNGKYLAVISGFTANGIYYCTNFTGSASDIFVQTASNIGSITFHVSIDGLNGLITTWQSSNLSNVIYYTRDGGQTWTNSGLTVASNQAFAISLSGQVGVLGFYNINDCWVTKDAGLSWTKYQLFSTGSPGFAGCAANNMNLVVVSSAGGIAYYGRVP